jgi:hypothetical protein
VQVTKLMNEQTKAGDRTLIAKPKAKPQAGQTN